MAAVLVKTVVFSSRLYSKGHTVDRWFRKLVTDFELHAIESAPMRTGDLKDSISADVVRAGRTALSGRIGSGSDHAMYVLRGTTGPIMSRRLWAAGGNPEAAFVELFGAIDPVTGKFTTRQVKGVKRTKHRIGRKGYFMGVRPVPHSTYTKTTARLFVAGQDPQNFLLDAWRKTARTHRVLRGATIPTFILHP